MTENIDAIQDSTTSAIEMSETPQPSNTRLGVWGCLWGFIKKQKDLIEYIDKVVDNSTSRIEEAQIEQLFVNSTSQNTESIENSIQIQYSGTSVQSSLVPLKIIKKIIKK